MRKQRQAVIAVYLIIAIFVVGVTTALLGFILALVGWSSGFWIAVAGLALMFAAGGSARALSPGRRSPAGQPASTGPRTSAMAGKKNRWTWRRSHFVITMIVGLVLLALGALGLVRPVTCGGNRMYPGDKCVAFGGASSSVQTYQEARISQKVTGAVETALGGTGVIVGTVGVVVLGVARRR